MSNKRTGQASLFTFGFNKNSSQPKPTSSGPVAMPVTKTSSTSPSLTVNVPKETVIASVEHSLVAGGLNKSNPEMYVPLAAPDPFDLANGIVKPRRGIYFKSI